MQMRRRRWPSDVIVLLEADGERVEARVSDVSEGGVKLHCPEFCGKAGQSVTIFAARQAATGEIRWTRGDIYGLSFRPGLTDDMLAALTGGLYRAPARETLGHRRSPAGHGRHGPRAGYLNTI